MLTTVSFRSSSIELLHRPLSIFRRSWIAYVGQFVLNHLLFDTDMDSKFFSPTAAWYKTPHDRQRRHTDAYTTEEEQLDDGLEQLTRSKRGFVVAVACNNLEKKLWF